MSQNVVEIIVKVRDAASGKLKPVADGLDRTGKAAKKAGADFTKFNRIMFSTTAFIGMFERALSRVISVVNEGANLDRLESSFEKTLGPSGIFFSAMKSSTDSAIDKMTAMESAIKIKSTGASNSLQEIAQSMAMATNAAKLMGKDSATGIKNFTDFVMGANVASLENLGLIRRTDASYQVFQATLHKAGGMFGGIIAQEARLRLGMKLLRDRTREVMFGNRDLADVLLDVSQNFKFMRVSVGRFIGTALKPLLEKVVDLVDSFTQTLDNIRKNEKNLMFLAKAMIIGTGAASALAVAFGTLRLATLALGSIGIGIPMLTGVIAALAGIFLTVTSGVEGFTQKLKVFAAFFKGTFQLVHSFLTDPEKFAKGIGEMDASIADLLRKNGLLTLAINIARVSSVVITFVRDTGKQLIDWAQTAFNFIEKLTAAIKKLFGLDNGPWSRSWVEGLEGIRGVAVKIAAAFVGFKLLQPILSRLPGVGGIFGGGGGGFGGKGQTPANPLWVAMAGGIGGALGGGGMMSSLGKGLGVAAAGAAGYALGTVVEPYVDNILDKMTTGTTDEGFTGNILERSFFKLDKLFGGETSRMFIENQKKLKALDEQGFGPGESSTTTSTVNPMPSESSLERENSLATMIMGLEGTMQNQIKDAFLSALTEQSRGGTEITKEEWIEIMSMGMDRSSNINKLANKKELGFSGPGRSSR